MLVLVLVPEREVDRRLEDQLVVDHYADRQDRPTGAYIAGQHKSAYTTSEKDFRSLHTEPKAFSELLFSPFLAFFCQVS